MRSCKIALCIPLAVLGTQALAQSPAELPPPYRVVQPDDLRKAAFQQATYVFASFANEHTSPAGLEWKPPCTKCTIIKAPFDPEFGFQPEELARIRAARGKIIIVCRTGWRSDGAARAFMNAFPNRNVFMLAGGMCDAGLDCRQ